MFHPIPELILKRMQFLERLDAQDRLDGTPHVQRLRQLRENLRKALPAALDGSIPLMARAWAVRGTT